MLDHQTLSESQMFLKYDYPETKEMCKQFLTLLTTVLVITLTFSEKIVKFEDASKVSKWLIISSWTSFLLAIISCGLGLLFITMAAGKAAYQGIKNYSQITSAYIMIIVAGGLFILGLILIISTSITTTYSNNTFKTNQEIQQTDSPDPI